MKFAPVGTGSIAGVIWALLNLNVSLAAGMAELPMVICAMLKLATITKERASITFFILVF